MLMPIWILVFGLVNGDRFDFASYWIVIDCFLTFTIFIRYFKNYSSAFLKVVATDEKQARRPDSGKHARIIVEGANIVRFEESVYSLAIALARHEKDLSKIITKRAKKEKISFSDRDKPVSSYEVAEVFGTAFFVLLCQGFAVGALLYAGLRSSQDNKWMVSTSEMTLMRFVTTTILHFHLTPVVTARLQLLKFVTYNP